MENAASKRSGVAWYEHCILVNSWVSKKVGLTSSEWTNSIKMSMNSMANRTTGGRSQENRHCKQREATNGNVPLHSQNVSHILRKYIIPYVTELGLSQNSYYDCKFFPKKNVQKSKIDWGGIIILDRLRSIGLVLDPIIYWGTINMKQDQKANEEKRNFMIYQPPHIYDSIME